MIQTHISGHFHALHEPINKKIKKIKETGQTQKKSKK
jgi:hypothetical protein